MMIIQTDPPECFECGTHGCEFVDYNVTRCCRHVTVPDKNDYCDFCFSQVEDDE